MCGITGFVNFNDKIASEEIITAMTSALEHRGPDGDGIWLDKKLAFGHRRLAIIDLREVANQPMVSKDKNYILSFNGEIYNFRELKDELISLGFKFISNSDSEVVLYSLINWGESALLKFNGMFALAFYDKKAGQILLGRDRYGIKPLYYYIKNSVFIFASEQKAILKHPNFVKKINHAGLLEYLTFQNFFTPNTLMKDINLLQPGHFAKISVSGEESFKIKKYWDYNFKETEKGISYKEYIEELRRLFSKAVERQLIGDVELGAYLSGGIDSGSITAIASKYFPNLKTFTVGFDISSASGIELSFDERVKAEEISGFLKTEHYQMVLKAGDMERCLPALTKHLEEPRVGQSYPNFYASKLTSKFVKVVLSGIGGDELFGGYPWRYYRATESTNFENFIDDYYLYWQRLVDNKSLKKLFSPIKSEVSDIWTRDIFRNVFLEHEMEISRPEDYINHSLYFEAKTFLHSLLVVEDKLSMAHSLESRVPFLDNDLVDFAMRCPVQFKLNNLSKVFRIDENESGRKKARYFTKSNDGKKILREAMSSYIPKNITYGHKQGFSSPDASWFKGESIDFVKNNILNRNARLYELLDYKAVDELVLKHINGQENKRLLIWSLLSLEAWLKENF